MTRLSELRQQVGQLLIMGFDGTAADARLRPLLFGTQPGGVILFARNLAGPRQTFELLRGAQQVVEQPLFTCIDMEGGTVDRLRDLIAPAPAAAHVFASASQKLFREHGRLIGAEVRALGFNVDFAPVLDLALPASRAVMTTRTVSAEPDDTAAYAREFLRGLRHARVLGCGKHFPGLGEADLDTHRELPSVRKSLALMRAQDWAPYRELRRELRFVMVAHAAYPEITGDRTPASLSRKWMQDILRRQIGFTGLVVSDDLEMGGVLAVGSIEEVAVETLRAGADLFLVCQSEAHVWRAYEAVLRQAEGDRRFARLVARAAHRVLKFKRQARELRPVKAAPTDRQVAGLRAALEKFAARVAREARA